MRGERRKVRRDKVIRDPIYGYIDVTPKHLKVINLPVFQRLRRISQLSFSDLVYPNAHNRFSHSLGVKHLARILRLYLEKNSDIGEKAGLKPKDYVALEWAGLLHDIGHLPFSHVSEAPFAKFIGKTDKWQDYHVKVGVDIINNPDFGISRAIPKGILSKVTSLISKNGRKCSRLLGALVTGMCNVDRLDYIRRDAHHAGCSEYAIIDYVRLLTTLDHYPDDPYMAPVFKEKARYALEGVILSYFNMYRAMYYHHAVRAAFLLFQDIIWEAFRDFDLQSDLKRIFKPEFWNYFDDFSFLQLLRNKSTKISRRIDQLTFRDLPKMVPLQDKKNISRILSFLTDDRPFEEKVAKEKLILTEIRRKYKDLAVVLLDSPIVTPYPRSSFAKQNIYIWCGKASIPPETLAQKAPYLQLLVNASEHQLAARVYVYPKNLTSDRKFCKVLNEVIKEVLKDY